MQLFSTGKIGIKLFSFWLSGCSSSPVRLVAVAYAEALVQQLKGNEEESYAVVLCTDS